MNAAFGFGMQRQTLYNLKAIRHRSVPELRTWREPRHLNARLMVGSCLGALIVNETCKCCDQESEDILFFPPDLNDDVHSSIVHLLMPNRFLFPSTTRPIQCDTINPMVADVCALDSDNMDIVILGLPDNTEGLFTPYSKNTVNDARILDTLASCEYVNPTVTKLFEHLHEKIRLRTAFRNLYFRALRKSFAPSGKQGCRAIEDGCTFLTTHVIEPHPKKPRLDVA